MKKVKIVLEVTLDKHQGVENIRWKSDDPPSAGKFEDAKGFFLSLFDKAQLETMKIDLWIKTMEIGEMDRMVYYTLKSLAETYYKATKNNKLANDIARFSQYFGEEAGIVPPVK